MTRRRAGSDRETVEPGRCDRAKIPLVECEDPVGAVAVGDDDPEASVFRCCGQCDLYARETVETNCKLGLHPQSGVVGHSAATRAIFGDL